VDSWIDFKSDLVFARSLAAKEMSLEEMIRAVYFSRADWDAARISRRTREVLDGPPQMSDQVSGWLQRVTANGPILDLGCGNGPMLVALHSAGHDCIGIDVSMSWLVVAQRMVRDAGHFPILAAGVAEALPLADGALGAVVSLDVIEHVRDVPTYISEINRVVVESGFVAISTPNRFSLSAEPHVFVWGVGWLPRRWQKQFVHWRSRKNYDDTVLLSYFELKKSMKRYSDFDVHISIPRIQNEHILNFSPKKAYLAKLYNKIAGMRAMYVPFSVIAPFFQMVGIKRRKVETGVPRTHVIFWNAN
jgi:SAM-dependent methyltransferase